MTSDPDLRQQLAASRAALLQAISGVSEEQFKKRPPAVDGETGWCIAEVLAHLLSQERLRNERISLALARDGSEITSSSPEWHDQAARAGRIAPVPQLIHGLLAARRETERLLTQAEAVSDGLQRHVLHPVRGRQTVAGMLAEQVIAHELEHVAQIEALRGSVTSNR